MRGERGGQGKAVVGRVGCDGDGDGDGDVGCGTGLFVRRWMGLGGGCYAFGIGIECWLGGCKL